MRTDYCGNIDASFIDQTVTINGWVNKRRDLGGVIFLDIRDREGIVQVVFDPDVEMYLQQQTVSVMNIVFLLPGTSERGQNLK